VLTHVSRRTGIRQSAKPSCAARITPERMRKRVQFLMDFEGAADAGDVDTVGPKLAENAPE
jgi:hypothetical protein